MKENSWDFTAYKQQLIFPLMKDEEQKGDGAGEKLLAHGGRH